MTAARLVTTEAHRPRKLSGSIDLLTQPAAAALLTVSTPSVKRAQALISGAPILSYTLDAVRRSWGLLAPVKPIMASSAKRSDVRRRIETARRDRNDVVRFKPILAAAAHAAAVTSQAIGPQLSPSASAPTPG